ncbi:hypothetical protein QQ045_016536 [Rhodiola kirilowii]
MAVYSTQSTLLLVLGVAHIVFALAASSNQGWDTAFATSTANAQEDSPCGFDSVQSYYGNKTAAISIAMYNQGLTCGACYEIACAKSSSCLQSKVQVTATSMCSPNYLDPTKNWCRQPLKHFQLPESVFSVISKDVSAVVPVVFRPVACVRKGGIRFRVIRHMNFVSVLVYNVGGAGDVSKVRIKGSETNWFDMKNSGNEIWNLEHVSLAGQSLSFQVFNSESKMVESDNVAPRDWKPDGTYIGGQFNF